MPKTSVSLAFLLACCVVSLFQSGRADDGVELISKAVDAQQNKSAIFSGRGSYDLVITPGGQSEEVIQAKIEEEKAAMEPRLTNSQDRDRILNEEIPRSVRERYTAQKRINGTFQFDYSKPRAEYTKKVLNYGDRPTFPTAVIEKRETSHFKRNRAETALFESGVHLCYVHNTPTATADFRHFGRLRGMTPLFIAAIIEKKGVSAAIDQLNSQADLLRANSSDGKFLEIVETKPFEDGSESFTIESVVNGRVTQRYTVVPSFGYICPFEQIYDPNTGNLTNEYLAGDYVLNERSGIYFPLTYVESEYDPATGNLIEKKEYKFDKESLSFNEPMNPKDFVLDIPEGLRVQDVRDGKNVSYIANTAGSLNLAPDGLDLSKMSWLTKKTEELSQNHSSGVKKEFRLIGRSLQLIGICMVLIGVGLAVKKRRGA